MLRSFSPRGMTVAILSALLLAAVFTQTRDTGSALADPLGNAPPQTEVNVGFSPGGGCTEAILKAICAARTSVLVQAELLTSAPIARQLIEKSQQRSQVIVILDKANAKKQRSLAADLANAGIAVRIDTRHGVARSNIIIIDRSVIITGGFGFTSEAENSNAENLVIIRNAPKVADLYVRSFESHLNHSVPYAPRGGAMPAASTPQNRKATRGDAYHP